MSIAILKSALKLAPAERIVLIQQLWDSIVDSGSAPALAAAPSALV